MLRAEEIKCDWDEDGLHLIIDGDSPDPDYQAGIVDYRVSDPEALYDAVKAAVLPWLMERDEALREYRLMGAAVEADMREAYDAIDPKHPDFHSVHADIWDSREGK